jgi:hypothetical protein
LEKIHTEGEVVPDIRREYAKLVDGRGTAGQGRWNPGLEEAQAELRS